MYRQISTRADYVEQMGVADGTMRLLGLQSNHLSQDFEVIAGTCTDHRLHPEYPDFSFAFIYPRTLTVEQIRMHLFEWLASAKAEHDASKPGFSC